MPRFRTAIIALTLALLAGCASSRDQTAATAAPTDPTDPWEHVNRQIFDVNLAIDRAVIKPVAQGYRDILGPWPRTRIRRFLQNMEEPRFLVNNALQGRLEAAGDTLARFVVNSTLGGAGFFDVATDLIGTPRDERDFGQTLYSWGVGDGPYVMVPLTGPNFTRDFGGNIVDGFLNPISWLLPFYANITRGAGLGIDQREQNIETLDALQRDSLDFYARLRSVWQQHRAAQLGRTTPGSETPDVLEDPGANKPQGVTPNVLEDPGAS
jgi:phospholipid-binding lipoprotein MlaA